MMSGKKSVNSTVYKCWYCGSEFCLLYRPKHGKKFCSKEHRIAYLREHPSLPPKHHKYPTRDAFLDAICELIKRKARYVPMDEICHDLHVCASEFKRLEINIVDVHKSLGIQRSVSSANDIVRTYLLKYCSGLESEATFDDLISPNGMVLRYDFRDKNSKLLVEVDGSMHRVGHTWYSDYRNKCADMKNAYAKQHGYTLVRIPVTKAYKLTDEFLDTYFQDIFKNSNRGNQQPELTGMSVNGSETDSMSRTDVAATGQTVTRRDADNVSV